MSSNPSLAAVATIPLPSRKLFAIRQLWIALSSRQPQLSMAAVVALLATIPCLLAMLVDPRTVNDISVWIKPTKFLVSFAFYLGTLAWAFGYLPRAAQSSRAGTFVIRGALAAVALEVVWLLLAALHGVPAHFNTAPVWRAAYTLAGVGSVALVSIILVQGWMIARQRTLFVAPALRWSLVAGAVIAFTCTLAVAGYLSSGTGHWVGGVASDAGGLPMLGWSRTGGDLRVAHFWALHAQQIIPAIGWLLAATGRQQSRRTVVLVSLAYVALIAFTFLQALQGEPFLAFIR